MIKHKGGKWVVYDSTGKRKLGEHDTEDAAKEQLRAVEANSIRVNLRATVNAANIRREQRNGRDHLVIPSYTLPADVVMNGGLYPGGEIDRAYAGLEGTLAPLGHPQVDGEYVSARTPEAINAYHVGAFNRNVEKRGHRVYLEKWVDVETAGQTEQGRRLLAAVAAGDPIHTSTGVFLRREAAKGDGYDWVARDMQFDHDAILLDEPGAAGPEQGVGMMVNTVLVPNLGERVLSADSYGSRMATISAAVRKRFGRPDSWVCIDDFDDRRVIYSTPEGSYYIDYLILDGVARLEGEPLPVQAETSYYAKNSGLVNKFWQWMRNTLLSEPVTPPEPSEELDMKPEEIQALLDQQAEKMTQAVNAAVATATEPLTKRLGEIESTLAANADAALAEKRKAAAEHLGVEVDTLAGMTANQLDAVLAKSAPAAPLLRGMPQVNAAALAAYDKPTA